MKKVVIEIKWALIFIATLLAWMFLEKLTGLHDKHIDKQQYITLLYVVPALLIYALALNDKKKNYYRGKMDFKEGFLCGTIITLIVTALSPLNQWIISEFITPNYFENVIEYSLQTGYFENRFEAEAQFNLTSYIIQSTIWAFGMGIVTSAIVALFIKSKK